MLQQLTIKNFGLIDNLSIEFNSRLNIFTGETGAGKSILIDALRIVLGAKLSSSSVRDKNKPCIIEAVFDLSATALKDSSLLQDMDIAEDELILQRIYSAKDNKNKIKINGLSSTLSQLKKLGDVLMDFHGPHDHQMLLNPVFHREMLDRLTALGGLMEEYGKNYEAHLALNKQLEDIQNLAATRDRELDMLNHQIKELEQVSLDDEAYQQIQDEQNRVNNAEKLFENAGAVLNLLDGGDYSPSEALRKTFSFMRALNDIDETTACFYERLSSLQDEHDQLIADLKDYAGDLSFDPSSAQEINAKADMYDDILRKYGPALADARAFYSEAKKKHELLANMEQSSKDLTEELRRSEKALKECAGRITQKRKSSAKALKKVIEQELKDLGIKNVIFEAVIEPREPNAFGADDVVFYISPNLGEDLKPLAEIVSSGEAARVMLALKKALIEVDPIPVLIFDEIDAQIGGRLGSVIGRKLKDIAGHRQVILITHLPQIAAFADAHFKVLKAVQAKRTITSVEILEKDARVGELAQMMSGQNQSDISVKHAKDLLAQVGAGRR